MGKASTYLRFNPDTREIELEGSEEFVKTYFDKLQQMLPQSPSEVGKRLEATTILSVKKATAKRKAKVEAPVPQKVVKVASNKAVPKKPKKVSQIDKVVDLVQESETGMTIADLQDKTGMTKKQIHAITSRAARLGRIKTTKRGVYVPV